MRNIPLAIVFDCFGVIYRDAFLDFMEQNRHRLLEPEDYYYRLSDASDQGKLSPGVLYEAFSRVTGEPPEAIKARIEDNVATLDTDTVDIIQELKHRYRMALISNIDRSFLDKFLAAGHVKNLFDNVLASSEVGHLKPSREIFEAMAHRLNIPFDRWLFIDDRIKNVRGASKHGIPSYHFTTAADLRKYLLFSGVLTH